MSPSLSENTVACNATLLTQLREELSKATACIKNNLLKEIREIGDPTSAIETQVDDTTTIFEAHEEDISFLREEVNELKLKLEDLENRSRRCNPWIRGLPEFITELSGTVTALLQKLAPNIPPERLERLMASPGHYSLLPLLPDQGKTHAPGCSSPRRDYSKSPLLALSRPCAEYYYSAQSPEDLSSSFARTRYTVQVGVPFQADISLQGEAIPKPSPQTLLRNAFRTSDCYCPLLKLWMWIDLNLLPLNRVCPAHLPPSLFNG